MYLRRFLRDGVSLLEHTSRSLQAPTPPTEHAADAGEAVQRRYRADCVARTQWTERDAVAELAVRAHLPVDQRNHFCQVTSAHTFYDTVVRHYSSLSPATRPQWQSSPLLGEVQQLVEEASVGTCTSTRAGGAAGGRQRQPRPPETLSPQQLREWAVRWGSPSGGAWGTSAGGVEAPGGVEATSLGACEPASTCAEPEEALHTFILDLGVSRCFFRDCTTVTPLTALVLVTLADPSGGPDVARGSTVLPCLAAPSGSLTGLHIPSFAKNLVATAVLQDQLVTDTQPGGELVAICTDSRNSEHLATFTQRPRSSMYTLTTASAQALLWHHRLGHPSPLRLRSMHSRLLISGLPRSLPPLPRSLAPLCLPCVQGRQRAAPHSISFSPTTAPLQTLYMDVWGPAHVTRQGGEHYFLLIVDDYTRYTTVVPLQNKVDVRSVLIHWICALCRQLSTQFHQDLPVLRLYSDRGSEFLSHLLENFSGAEGITKSFMLPASPEQNGIAEHCIGLVMEVAHTSLVYSAAPDFLWPFAVQYAAHQLNLVIVTIGLNVPKTKVRVNRRISA
ncbi:unnamed protein product [Closterium sp. NIES-53]